MGPEHKALAPRAGWVPERADTGVTGNGLSMFWTLLPPTEEVGILLEAHSVQGCGEEA